MSAKEGALAVILMESLRVAADTHRQGIRAFSSSVPQLWTSLRA
jgi:hypothetical protein